MVGFSKALTLSLLTIASAFKAPAKQCLCGGAGCPACLGGLSTLQATATPLMDVASADMCECGGMGCPSCGGGLMFAAKPAMCECGGLGCPSCGGALAAPVPIKRAKKSRRVRMPAL